MALRSRGHDVTVLTNSYFEDLIVRAGLRFEALGTADEFRATLDDPRLWSPRHGLEFVMRRGVFPLMRRMYEAVCRFYRPGQTVVVGSTLALGARIAQEKQGIPYVSIHLQPTIFQSLTEPPQFPALSMKPWWPRLLRRAYYALINRVVDGMIGPDINAFRAELGLAPTRDLIKSWWHSPKQVIGLFPVWYAAPQPDWPSNTHLTGFPLYDAGAVEPDIPELEDFLIQGPPPVIFTPGSAMKQAASFFRESVEVCRRLKCRGLLLTKFPEQLPAPLPEGVRHFSYVPFSKVLSRAAAFVHHGGIGTTAQALSAGVPQLVTPFAHDQPDNAARVVKLGVGLRLAPSDYRAAAASECIQKLMGNPSFRAAAQRLQKRFETPKSLTETCSLIESQIR